jgi:hypothetical protein
MATLPPETILPRNRPATSPDAASDTLAAALTALHGQAATLALLARIAAEPVQAGTAITTLVARARPWQRNLVAQAVADCSAMLESGLAALATLSGRGQDTAAPALTLWREFHAARAAMLAVLTTADPA